jgi:hypothetical protein
MDVVTIILTRLGQRGDAALKSKESTLHCLRRTHPQYSTLRLEFGKKKVGNWLEFD